MLEAYHKNFPDFICGSLTIIEVSSQDEKTKVRFNGTAQEQEVQIGESQELRSGVVQEEDIQPNIP